MNTLRMMSCLLFAAATAMPSSYAQKSPYNGSATQFAGFAAVYERSRAAGQAMPVDLEDIGYFKGFVAGVFMSHQWPCSAYIIPMDQVEAVVAKYLRENPERWGLQARDLVIEAADRVWGCKDEPNKKAR